ncbi:HAD-IIIC family phosphatase [Alloacidobacterium dinghuense]|uniref:HAD-IIIC family phosphatase n=1 Tax=Alloacidobacterium dinghuense TaxID=2763107 RepID=A0A7G8BLS8_9BACT|nr:HAD-IIIC family phosphatase [Alloacidobacterium dinghuense]QNI33498.1 HAD-IIIC family phosphatase [Alloacidobacterium dinghuense]
MKLIDALQVSQSPAGEGWPELRIFLACGFTPLHLHTFLAAHLRSRLPGVRPEIRTGLFGDLFGNIERLKSSEADLLVVALEWSDLDPRLGIRSLGGWRPSDVADIARFAELNSRRLLRALEGISRDMTAVVSLPTLPLPPAFTTRPVQSGLYERQLDRMLAQLAESLSGLSGVRILNEQKLAAVSAPAARYDVKSDLATGFPYTLGHASAMGELLACLIENRMPMKGLITDLDDTLWSGIVGDDGVDAISWNLDKHSQMHGVYQQFLSSLAAAGVLLGVASKNDAATVAQAFERRDMLLSKEDVFPFEVHWSRKSESVRRILSIWNIAADAVVFIDDNPAEIAEVEAAFPELTCRLFPKGDSARILTLLEELRDLFGKPVISEEDSMRIRSIRNAGAWRDASDTSASASDEFIQSAEGRIWFECSHATDDLRAFELVNKTNQFNLNGKRYAESEWRQFLANPAAFLLTAAYEDKFGALGKIAVLLGTRYADRVHVQAWVMSCRAFSRRIEHQCLQYLFDEFGVDRVSFEYTLTPRNGPLQEFLKSLVDGALETPVCLTKEMFFAKRIPLFHRVEVSVHV